MCSCEYAYVCVCMFVCMYICMYVCMRVCDYEIDLPRLYVLQGKIFCGCASLTFISRRAHRGSGGGGEGGSEGSEDGKDGTDDEIDVDSTVIGT